MSEAPRRVRLFLDTGVIVEGCYQRWGASKVILILCTHRKQYTVVLAEDVERELRRILARKSAALAPDAAHVLEADVAGWLSRVHIERWPRPTVQDVESFLPTILPVLRHINDLRLVVTAMQARPNWVISSNRAYWNEQLASRAGLRITTPQQFMRSLSPSTV